MQTPQQLPRKRPPTWMDQNWKWVVPLIVVVVAAGIVGFATLIFGFMKSSDAYTGALARAKASPAVAAALGTPVKDSFYVLGNFEVNTQTGRANLQIPVSGPKGSATLYVDSVKADGVWHFRHLVVVIKQTGEHIDLLAGDKPAKSE